VHNRAVLRSGMMGEAPPAAGGTKVYADMEQWIEIRRRVLVEGMSKLEACKRYAIHFLTLKKILSHEEPPGYQLAKPPARPLTAPSSPSSGRFWTTTRRPRRSSVTRRCGLVPAVDDSGFAQTGLPHETFHKANCDSLERSCCRINSQSLNLANFPHHTSKVFSSVHMLMLLS
jgi:hypothetical protein